MKTIITFFVIAWAMTLEYGVMSQSVSGSLTKRTIFEKDDLRDEKMKEMLKSRIKHFSESTISTKNQVKNDLNAPDWNWVITLGGKGGVSGSDIATDIANNYYVIGNFNGFANFGSQTKTSLGLWDVFLAKYNSSGNLLWIQQISSGTNQSSYGIGISLDAANNIYITGNFNGSLTFGTFSLTTTGGYDAFTAKYDNGGNFIWAKKYGSMINDENVAGMATDPNGNIYVAGNASNGQFLVKYNSDGQYLWETHTIAHVTDIAYGNSGIFLTGYIEGTTTFGSFTLNPSNGWNSSFISKQDPSGAFTWANYVESFDGGSYGTSITIDISGNIFTAGWFYNTNTFIPTGISLTSTNEPYFVAMYNSSGICQWATQVTDNYGAFFDFQILLDNNNNLYTCGSFDHDFTFGNSFLTGSGTFIAKIDLTGKPQWMIKDTYTANKTCISNNNRIVQTGAIGYNLFITAFNLTGILQWSQMTTSDGGSASCWYTISVDSTGRSYLHGRFDGNVNFLGTTLSGSGVYTAKISQDHQIEWVKTLNLTSTRMVIDPSGIITDKENNSYVWGTFSDSLNVEGTLITNPNPSGIMGYLVKYDKDANFKWIRTFTCTSSMLGTGGIATDTSGNVLITGQYYGILTIGSYTFPSTTNYYNSFFAKYNPKGDLQFAKTFTGLNSMWYIWDRSIACDKLNNIFISGLFRDTVNFGTTSLSSRSHGRDIFIAKYDSSGNELWAKAAGGTSTDRSTAIVTDDNGNAYITGYFYGQSISFDGITITSPYQNGINLYVAKYAPNGTAIWARAIQSPQYTWPLYKLSIDQNGDCYVGGDYYDTLKFDNGPLLTGNYYCHFVAKYTTNGDFEWSQNLSGTPTNLTSLFATAAITDQTIYIAGYLTNDVISFGSNTISSANTNGFLALLGSQVGIPSISQYNSGVELFPNPATQILYLEFDQQPEKSVTYSLSDLTGKILLSNTTEASKLIKITLPKLSQGVYFISVNNGLGEFVRKVIIE